ncbi:butyrophilin subfamily 1 member A1 isoform X3 [Ictalurus punctatus]|uniref:Butyrophilin subfamily 1 member A1 isoform X3 n=1 Tax=Ictalurus punctatus TaxID=7998 RepID=A0A2D0QES8_ICTPU|nr:butyrophilin subfamily 1 member A1 isoform X3 [Ictalurus punctatus]
MILICIASVLACSAAEFSVVTPNASVSAPLGSSVVLPCGLSPSLSARTLEVHWYKNDDINNPVLLYQDQKVQENIRTEYRDRVSLIGELDKGNVSLKLDNLTTVDSGEYTCFVKSLSWYDKHSVNLLVKGSEGLMNVSSWLLISLSDLEWISCTVGLNQQEVRESRVVPHKGFWREAFISTLVLSLIVLIAFTVLLILFRRGLLSHCSSHKNPKAAADSPESSPAETVPLNAAGNSTQNTTRGISDQGSYVPPEPTEERSVKDRYKVTLTLNPSTAHRSLRVSGDRERVHYKKTNADCKSKFPHVVSKEELGSGHYYWEVMISDRTSSAKPKSSWCVGVTQKPHSEDVLRALCYEEGTGLYPNTADFSKITIRCTITRLGLHLNCEMNSLSFYNVDKTPHGHLYTFNNIPHATYFALFSPGVKDVHPLRIIKLKAQSQLKKEH